MFEGGEDQQLDNVKVTSTQYHQQQQSKIFVRSVLAGGVQLPI